MTGLTTLLAILAALAASFGAAQVAMSGSNLADVSPHATVAAVVILAAALIVIATRTQRPVSFLGLGALGIGSHAAVLLLLFSLGRGLPANQTLFGFEVLAAWLMAWAFVNEVANLRPGLMSQRQLIAIVIPVLFGLWILALWELLTRGFAVPTILLPPPSLIGARIAASVPTLWADFQQTFLKAVLAGYVLGCGAGFVIAIAIDRSPFLKRGLLPLGNFVSALPIVGIAPILVMWFGFDWPSKAAVVVVMTFFPMLVNTVAGLNAAGQMERDMMRTYAAGYWQTLFKLRLPAAAPFIFNALKINSTLALIGAIVAEFFGTPIVGMGFRISTEVGRMNVDMVWAEIAVAAVAGSLFYFVVVLVERAVTFWHPSVRGGRA
jgi:NitT/TauT family transport system permease protein